MAVRVSDAAPILLGDQPGPGRQRFLDPGSEFFDRGDDRFERDCSRFDERSVDRKTCSRVRVGRSAKRDGTGHGAYAVRHSTSRSARWFTAGPLARLLFWRVDAVDCAFARGEERLPLHALRICDPTLL